MPARSQSPSPAKSTASAVVAGIIPARWGSTRFPGKPLHPIAGKPLIRHVWERCQACQGLDRVIIATDDDRIAGACRDFGAEIAMTRSDHPSGTDRIAEVARKLRGVTHAINIQGDEPLIDPGLINQLARLLARPGGPEMITAANPMEPGDPAFEDPNVVKVVLDRTGHALYFSRSPIPYPRGAAQDGPPLLRHKGIYGFSRAFLLKFVRWNPSPLELREQLEQLRALENGARIRVILTKDQSPGIDTPEQAALLNEQLSE